MSSCTRLDFPLKCVFTYFCILLITLNVPCECLSNKHSTCEKISACQCIFPIGMGIDLSKLEDYITPLPWLTGNSTDNNATFYFQPCVDVPHSGGDNECSGGAALCLYDKVKKQYTLLGKIEESSFISGTETDPVYLKYLHNNISTTILLTCSFGTTLLQQDSVSLPSEYTRRMKPYVQEYDPSRKNVTLVICESSQTKWIIEAEKPWTPERCIEKLTLHSPLACPEKMDTPKGADIPVIDHSLSTGSVLVILFVTFSVVYLLGGALILKLTRGAEGKELVPNYDFWSELPNLVRDGVMFLLNGCTAAATYDRI